MAAIGRAVRRHLPHAVWRHLPRAVWRRLPRVPRRAALTYLAAALAPKPDATAPAHSAGVVVAGEIFTPNGLGDSAHLLHQALAGQGLARGLIPLGLPGLVEMGRQELPPGAALLAVVNAPFLPASLLRLPRQALRGRKIIGFWAWELPVVPPAWAAGARFVHEIWAPSGFTAAALAHLAPARVRAVPFPLAALDLPARGTRAEFGLPEGVFIVTCAFNLASSMARKNPLGAIAAFRAAFGASANHLLLLKLANVADYAADLAAIRTAIAGAHNIRVMSETIPAPLLRGLLQASDVVLSLHRAEGFGLIPATAMLLGRPVVATGWSGNMEFMDAKCSGLVPYKLIPARDSRGTYAVKGAHWAEPDVAAAAEMLRHLAADAPARTEMGRAGQAYAREKLSLAPLLAAVAAAGIA